MSDLLWIIVGAAAWVAMGLAAQAWWWWNRDGMIRDPRFWLTLPAVVILAPAAACVLLFCAACGA